MGSKIANDTRLDPRIRTRLRAIPEVTLPDVASREELLALVSSDAARAARKAEQDLFETFDTDAIVPSAGFRVSVFHPVSEPDGNKIAIRFVRPDTDVRLPCVYYIHGGGMNRWSCFNGNYRLWARMIAAQGVAVAMIDFRNAVEPSSLPEVAPFPAGLNDCLSGLSWVRANADTLNIDAQRVIVAGESGGGNLTLATGLALKRAGALASVKGLYALCPYVAGQWPQPHYPSSTENEGIVLNLHNNRGRMGYGIAAYEARNPLAWPGFATVDDVTGFPPTIIRVNECDPLCDEGVAFYRLLLSAGVSARCRQVMGTTHGIEIMPVVCPDISRDAAADIAEFATR